jgi:8-oxo-dGTP pyrophosphatase MutT (NUDIX family)
LKKLGLIVGKIAFWVSWPALWVYLKQRERTRALILCGNEFLVLRGWLGSGDWSLPGGGLHKGENSLQGVLREVQEETGIALYEHDVTFLSHMRSSRHGLSYAYDCFVVELAEKPAIKLQKLELADYAWVPLKNPQIHLSEDARQVLARWQNKA